MGKILKDEQVHQRRVTVTFSAHELRELIVLEAMRIAGADAGTMEMKIRQEERGSPAYTVDHWVATVNIVQELKP